MSKRTFRSSLIAALAVGLGLILYIAFLRGPTFAAGLRSPPDLASRPTSSAPATERIRIPVLCYHQTYSGGKTFAGYNVSPEVFEAQLQWLHDQGYKTITLAQMEKALAGEIGADFPEKPIVLTFDDGLTSQRDVVLPLLKRFGMTGVLFLYPTIIETKNKYYMRWEEVQEVVASGVFEIGSHTLSHPKMPLLSRPEIRKQLEESRRILQEKLQVDVFALAYPFGLYDGRVIDEARSLGYRLAFTINPGQNEVGTDPFRLHRFMLMTEHTMKTFQYYLELPSPAPISFVPEDGSYIRPRQELTVQVPPEYKNVRVQLGSRKMTLAAGADGRLKGQFPGYTTKTGLLYLTLYAQDASGKPVQRQLLYLDQGLHGPED